jgi:hypothetical protein
MFLMSLTNALKSPFSTHDALYDAGRLPALSQPGLHPKAWEMALLFGMGALSALAVSWIQLDLRLPGHHIVLSMFPMALGLSLAPRRLGGTLMGGGAFAALLASGFGGMGVGAWAGLLLLGPARDLALRPARRGAHVYLGLVLAGIGANLGAMGVRALAKMAGFRGLGGGGRGLVEWWQQAQFTYPAFGALAGILSAAVWFHFRAARQEEPRP